LSGGVALAGNAQSIVSNTSDVVRVAMS